MSRFFSEKFCSLTPYVPGEQPQDKKYIKLNTNESPYPPSPSVTEAVQAEANRLHLYSDPECALLRRKMSDVFGAKPEEIVMGNGSDEILNFAFAAFADANSPLLFPDITYGFYPVFAALNGIPYRTIPLAEDFSITVSDYCKNEGTVVFANPNAPTGLSLPLSDVEKIVRSNPDHVVIVDEAYVDFGGESALSLVRKYKNLLVVGTFSKSRSLAGGRLGFGFGCPELIADLNTLRYSTNPYNINRLTMAAGIAVLDENEYYMQNCEKIKRTRTWTAEQLRKEGFFVLPSNANFLFVKSDLLSGEYLYRALKLNGILVRHFTLPRIAEYNRITVGTQADMETLIRTVREIKKEYQS